jgi:uncharacterized protein YbjT (DUF2867 family)
MPTEILFQIHLVLGYVTWLLCFGVYIWPWLKSMDPVEAQGAIRLPWGKQSTVLPLVSAEDVARIATGLLTSPALTAGTAYPVIGAAISLNEIIATFGRVLNKDVHYEEITDEQWRNEALARGWNAHAVEHLSSLWKALRAASLSPEAGRFAVTESIEKIGGTKPLTFEQFVREQQSELATLIPAKAPA